ncbi:MAG: CPBP family intramembrane metalloprotease [Verrucomicrobiota bacterium]|nr:CPBP family intramembrane metalloprotease [Verrucomicrobiota bacterium]
MKDAARLLAYLAATLLFGALAAPLLYWGAQSLTSRGALLFLAKFDFETYFHRALLLGALLFFWPLLRWLRIRSMGDLGIIANRHRLRDVGAGFGFAAIPLLLFGALILLLGVYSLRPSVSLGVLTSRALSAIVVPFIEEPLFRGLILGVLLRSNRRPIAILLSSAFFSLLHFLKAPEHTSTVVTWNSGFVSIAHSFAQFSDPLLVLAGFTTLFLLGWILADARIRTRSLWLPIGLHAGWIFSSAIFNKLARRELLALPWLGNSLLVGLAPLGVALITWALLRVWLKHEARPA